MYERFKVSKCLAMLLVPACILIALALAAGEVPPSIYADGPDWYAPAYFEPQEAIYLLATTETSVDPAKILPGPGDATTPIGVQARLAAELAPHVKVRVLVNPDDDQRRQFETELRKLSIENHNITFHNVSHCDIWTRDTGPIWIRNRNPQTPQVKMVKPVFTLWGYVVPPTQVEGPWANCDVPNKVPDQISADFGYTIDDVAYATEGGDKSFNGKGSVIMSQAVELQRNPGKSLHEIAQMAKDAFRISHVVWVNQGVGDDEQSFRGALVGAHGEKLYTTIGTGGHVDEFCRFVNPTTVLLAQVSDRQRAASPLANLTWARLEEDYKMLLKQTDQDGTPLKVIRLPVPDELTMKADPQDGTYDLLKQLPALKLHNETIDIVLAASYNNYVIANGVIVLPKYAKPGRSSVFAETDMAARKVMETVFPGRKIVQINPEPVNAGGGGLNCISNNQPAP